MRLNIFKIAFFDMVDRRLIIYFLLFLTVFLFPTTSLCAKNSAGFSQTPQVNSDSVVKPRLLTVEPVKRDSLLKNQNAIANNEKSSEEFSERNVAKQEGLVDTLGLSAVMEISAKELVSDSVLRNDSIFFPLDSLTLSLDSLATDSLIPEEPPFVPILLDSLLLESNPFFIDLVYKGMPIDFYWRNSKEKNFFFDKDPSNLYTFFDSIKTPTPQEILKELRRSAFHYIAVNNFDLYKMTFHDLPVLSWNTFEVLKSEKEKVFLEEKADRFVLPGKIKFQKRDFSFWTLEVKSLLQFSQISVTDNWHKGGSSYLTVLGNVSGRMDYDDRKKIKWENSLELRTGFNAVDQDSLRSIMPSDDLLKGSSKFGLKAGKDLYYSSSLEFQTQLFNNPKKINSRELKAKFLTPLRLNIGVGIDYKPNKILSVALSPLSYKVIYLADTSPNVKHPEATIDPNAFGIKKGKSSLQEFGSKLIVVVKDYRPLADLKIDSRFSFYTNYEKIEVDWETIAEYTLNRFLSTRLLLNPRFDNTAILKKDEKARMQMKQILTVGISYRFY